MNYNVIILLDAVELLFLQYGIVVITTITCEFMQDGKKIRTTGIVLLLWLSIVKCRMWHIC
jgi:ribosomal protein S7